eukprot:scaffold8995_cov120-Isochrysis_galbana.AAC.7
MTGCMRALIRSSSSLSNAGSTFSVIFLRLGSSTCWCAPRILPPHLAVSTTASRKAGSSNRSRGSAFLTQTLSHACITSSGVVNLKKSLARASATVMPRAAACPSCWSWTFSACAFSSFSACNRRRLSSARTALKRALFSGLGVHALTSRGLRVRSRWMRMKSGPPAYALPQSQHGFFLRDFFLPSASSIVDHSKLVPVSSETCSMPQAEDRSSPSPVVLSPAASTSMLGIGDAADDAAGDNLRGLRRMDGDGDERIAWDRGGLAETTIVHREPTATRSRA